jgi:hypothetical protein
MDVSLNMVSWVFRLEETIQIKGKRQLTETVIRKRWIIVLIVIFFA